MTEQLGGESGIDIVLSQTPRLTSRQDSDALNRRPIIAVQQLNIRSSRDPVAVTLNAATGASTFVCPAVVGTAHPAEPHWWRGELGAAWVVGYASFGPPPAEWLEGAGAATFREPSDEEVIYVMMLDALEARERHNATGAASKIRAGVAVSAGWAPGLLRAYREYRGRAAAGLYN
ncbi:MAG TPA: hypothetical protein VGP82_16860 [Ktedonobacterales bacterium]|nr:hypothetical protein [Ktedonobacterales bacterium]